jgi:hypothetical protein
VPGQHSGCGSSTTRLSLMQRQQHAAVSEALYAMLIVEGGPLE